MHANGSTPPLVSVIVPARDAARGLRNLLPALAEQTVERRVYEVVVVDDGSADATHEVVRGSGIARLVEAPAPRGSYAARNLGIGEARGEILAFTDADCIPAPDWIERALARFATSDASLLAGHVHVVLPSPPTRAALLDYRFLDQERYVRDEDYGVTANLWVRRGVIAAIGPFNPLMVAGGDAEFGKRAAAAGFATTYCPEIRVDHAARRRLAQVSRKGFRVGYGTAVAARRGQGPMRRRARWLWRQPGAYLPQRRLFGIERLRRSGLEPRGRELLALLALQYLGLRLPMLAGNLVGSLRRLPKA